MGKTKKSAGSATKVAAAAKTKDEITVTVDEDLTEGIPEADATETATVTASNDIVADTAPDGAPASPAPQKKTLGTKEIIPFAWKVIGRSGEMILTLFKSIERVDADTHHARLERDGNYKDLQVVALNHKIVQSKSVKEQFVAKAFRDKDDAGSGGPAGKKSGGKSRADRKSKKVAQKETRITTKKKDKNKVSKTAAAKSKKSAKKSAKKKTAKSASAAKKKPAAKTPSKKKAAKKKTVKKKVSAKKTAKKKKAAKKKK